MAGFADLIPKAQPALVGGGVSAAATEGATWEWTFTGIVDDTGAPVDLSGVTVECEVLPASGKGDPLVTLTGVGGSGVFTVSADATVTAGLGSRQACWSCRFTGPDGDVVQVWGPESSPFQIRSA